MTRNPSISGSEARSITSRASELSILNDDECKRVLSVVERDFKLRQQEYKRLDEIKKLVRQENERVQYLGGSQEFNAERCIRCFKPFRIFFNPKESCTECKFFVCHECATYTSASKTWACKTCLELKNLEGLTSDWFYFESSRKHKRCGSAKIVRELHKREKELADLDEYVEEDLGYGTLPTNDSGSLVSFVPYDTNVKRELKEYSTRLKLLVDKLQEDLSERNTYNNHRSVREKLATIVRRGGKEGLKAHQQQLTTEIARARVALSGPLRRSNTKTNTTHERDLQNLLVQQTEQVLQTNLQQFHKTLTAPNSSINTNNFDQKLAQTIFDKCVSKEIFQELPDVIDVSAPPPPKPLRQTSNTSSSLTSLTKPSFSQPTWSNSSSASWEIKSRNDNIRKVIVSKRSAADEEEDTIKEDIEEEDDDDEHLTNGTNKQQALPTTTESIEFDNGLKLDLSSIDDETSNRHYNRRSIDSDLEAIKRSKAKVGEWQTNFTLIESKSSHSGDDTPRSTREAVYLTLPNSENKDLSPRIGDKPLEDLADDDLYADDASLSYPIPINTITFGEHSQISDNDSTANRKLFPLPANLLLQNHSSCSFRRPSYTYESDNDSITSTSNISSTEMKPFIDEDKFRMDPSITDPKFILRPKDTTSRHGETARFKTKVQGTEPIDVFWFRFGTDDEINNDEKYQLSHDDSYHYLKIFSTRKEDEGAYLCVIANDKAQNVDIAKLYVKDNKRTFHPPSIITEFTDTDVYEGSSLTLKCKLDQGYPKARVVWYKENTLIQPNGHYKLYYYGDGQHVLHVDEATIEDDNGTFTCLALNAAGRVQITADVFVHEKEVIDIPRDSPVVRSLPRTLRKQQATRENSNMNDDDENREGIPLTMSPPLSPVPRPIQSDDEELNAKRYMDKFRSDRSSQLLENWQHLYEASVQSLETDDVDLRTVRSHQKPYYLERSSSIEKPAEETPRSPIILPQAERNVIKPKWEIRLPQLLNSTVGPDRQKRDSSRRHTTNVVFQQNQQQSTIASPSNTEFNPASQSYSSLAMSAETDGVDLSSPLVRQLKQKFDRMSSTNLAHDYTRSHSQSHIHRVGHDENDGAYPLLPDQAYRRTDEEDNDKEVASLTCRGLTSNNGERSTPKSRPVLPMQPLHEKNANPITSVSFDATLSANKSSFDKGEGF
ncbi:hypothetical protein I4U23_030798 [Adineta vaga]|nr:hypothetical protein I4U23_030798 [Adineta vaga]